MNTQTKQTAAESVEMRLFRINVQLDRLMRHNKKQEQNFDPDKVTWADDGTLGHIEAKLQELSDFVFQEGEHTT